MNQPRTPIAKTEVDDYLDHLVHDSTICGEGLKEKLDEILRRIFKGDILEYSYSIALVMESYMTSHTRPSYEGFKCAAKKWADGQLKAISTVH